MKGLVVETALRAPFLISLSVQGHLDSQKNSTLTSMVEGSTTIIYIVPEGTWVTQGEVVCELDSSVLREEAKQQEITVTQAEAALATAREALEIQKTQNESDIAAAKLASELAKLDQRKFQFGDYVQQQSELQGNVAIAEEELARAKETLEFTKDQVKKGYMSQNEYEAARIAVKQADLKVANATALLEVLEDYTLPRTMAELEANAKEFELELQRVKLKADSALTQAQKTVEAAELTYEVEKERLERLKTQIANCVLRAPQDGEVVYAVSESRRSEPVIIEEGATVRERQPLINLPDVTKMKVEARVHESLIRAVEKGLKSRIRVDAYPGEIYNGVISHVSSVPMSGSWPNIDLREYPTEIQLTDDVEKVRRLRPGLTAQVEILVDNRKNVLQVPIQCVVTVADTQIAYVATAGKVERRTLKIGQSNQSHIEIIDGIEEGEQVVMNPRTRFAGEITALEAELNAANKAEAEAAGALEPPVTPGIPSERGNAAAGVARGGPGGEAGRPPGPPRGGGDPAAFFARLDQNGDGSLTRDELPEQMQSRFSDLDSDGNGSISREELSARAGRGGPPQ